MSSRSFIRQLVNRAWIVSCSREHARFTAALGRVAEMQADYLLRRLQQNATTRFGRKHDFTRIRSVAEYQEKVPLTDYEALGEYIEAIARGEDGVLTAGRVQRFQPTSGSTSATKFIPWTGTLAREFRRGIAPWMAALYRRKPALLPGTAYWSLSPPVTSVRTRGRLPVGFDHDAEYLGFFGRNLFSHVSAVPADVVHCPDMREFKTRTLVSLLADEDLRFISIWSPTFLSTLLENFLSRRDDILNVLGRSGLAGAKRRADFLRTIIRGGTDSVCFEQVWPHLQVISCWTHGPSELYAANLRHHFPTVEIQGKGLICTEAFVSLPFHTDTDPVLAVTSHFFEFQDPVGGKIFLAHELTVGSTYRVIATTDGGLYRYNLGDLVRVTGFIQDAPCFRFMGREGNISDLFGEKLQGVFVEEVIRRLLARQGVEARFFLLAPVTAPTTQPGYTLFLDADKIPRGAALADSLEAELAGNFHYAHCRRLGQLASARVFQIHRTASPPEACFQKEMLNRGIKPGDIKMAPVDSTPGWERRFHGHYLA